MKIREFNPKEIGRLFIKDFFRFCFDQTAIVNEVINPPKRITINVKNNNIPPFDGEDIIDNKTAVINAIVLKKIFNLLFNF
jgi:hypothetical protein